MATQAAAAVQSLALAALTLMHVITLWEIIALTALQGVINAFDMPGRQSFLVKMVEDREDLSNAIAINSSMANGARLVGPAIAGLVIGAFGEGWCFLIDGVSYFAVIASLLLMRIKPMEMPTAVASEHVGADARGLGLCADVSSDSNDTAAVCADQFDGLLVRCAAAGVCGAGAAWRGAHAGVADGRVGGWSAGVGAFAGCAEVGCGADADGADCVGDAGRGADSVWSVAALCGCRWC